MQYKNLSPKTKIPRGLSTGANSVYVSILPSLSSSINLMICPFPASLPKDPIMSTPTKTSPVGATARHAGLGVTSGPTNLVYVSPAGHFGLSSKEPTFFR